MVRRWKGVGGAMGGGEEGRGKTDSTPIHNKRRKKLIGEKNDTTKQRPLNKSLEYARTVMSEPQHDTERKGTKGK